MRQRREWLVGLACLGLAGCATVINGFSQEVGITSQPPGAAVTVDAEPRGQTPLVASVSRRSSHTVKVELEGYQPVEGTIMRHMNGWVWGNLAFGLGGVLGLGLDLVSGGMYDLVPRQLDATLAPLAIAQEPLAAMLPAAAPVAAPLPLAAVADMAVSAALATPAAPPAPVALVAMRPSPAPVVVAAVAPAPVEGERRILRFLLQYTPAPLLGTPDLAAAKVGTVDSGATVQVLEETDAWLRVATRTGQRGWLARAWLRR